MKQVLISTKVMQVKIQVRPQGEIKKYIDQKDEQIKEEKRKEEERKRKAKEEEMKRRTEERKRKEEKEKGIIQRKRGRMVYSEIAKDWVPRWGKGSIKKIENEANWALEEKEFGINPFDKKNQEKNLVKQKQKMREIKNKIRNSENENNVFNNKTVFSY